MLTLNVGTNNSGGGVDGHLGAVWGGVVNWVSNHAWGDDYIEGANDVEAWNTSSSSYTDYNNWMWGDSTGNGYAHATSDMIVDFGSANGCDSAYYDSNYDCGDGYWFSNYYYIAWGWGPSLAQPEIYYDESGAHQPVQWANISHWGMKNGHSIIGFDASLSQYPRGGLSPDDSYYHLVGALNYDGVGYHPPFESQIVWK